MDSVNSSSKTVQIPAMTVQPITPQSSNSMKIKDRPTSPTPNNYASGKSSPKKNIKRIPGKGGSIGRSGGPPSTNRPCKEHSFITDVTDVQQMEQGLLQLLDDFHSGKLQAFVGHDCSFEKMDQVREQQERLARLHFDFDSQQELHGIQSLEARSVAKDNLVKLIDNLQLLSNSIEKLHSGDTIIQPIPVQLLDSQVQL